MDNKSISSRLRDLVKFLSSVQGDLSNITAPPFFLAPTSVVEAGHCWAQRPAVFAAPAFEPSAEKRALLVLRLVLVAMRSQFYIAGSPSSSIKKPLNAFLGELFLASWTDSDAKATTRLVAEQVSHHPPITAMHIADRVAGVRADGYARVEMTFAGSVDVRQVGHAVLHVDAYDEDYLIPLPDVKVRGFLSGRLYPEVQGTYRIASSSGFVSELRFSGAGLCWGARNAFKASVYHRDDPERKPIYEAEGVWSEGWTVRDARTGEILEQYEVDAPGNAPAPMDLAAARDQDAWESRRAWAGVREALEKGDFRETVAKKTRVEQAQRKMRAHEVRAGETWEPLLFRSSEGKDHEVFHRLAAGLDWKLYDEKTKGVWKVDDPKIENLQQPFRGELTPLG